MGPEAFWVLPESSSETNVPKTLKARQGIRIAG
jgi:hypothetical protein